LSFGAACPREEWEGLYLVPVAAGADILEEMSATVRQYRLHRLTSCTTSQLAREISPVVRSWVGIN
jgi:hypothetical protein